MLSAAAKGCTEARVGVRRPCNLPTGEPVRIPTRADVSYARVKH